ncbi:hypothetical protein EI77_00818 [Prosthecobacter fusiformis]|uniref:Tetratricopeptide repeat protein n=1 Tax=Prosthecobacter fusiformis TaxID=48464 RepID=A0A4R7STD3_9BACT|nr:hypothetical protein [Prosthecobacter fusiformis]TDU81508.1 hypothetical protein EI77_00818 [Prosthecobacter fusiformis]
MKRKLQALMVFLILGVLKLPVDEAATRHLREARLLSPPLEMSLRDSIGQMGFAASLGGLRSLVASLMYLQTYDAWSNVDWGRVDSYFKITTALQPRYDKYWDEAAWHMAYNAATSYLENQEINPAVRGKLYHDHIQRGVDILKEGLKVLPDSPRLWNTLAEVYERRVRDPQKAGDCYLEVMRLTGNPRFGRLAGYEYAKTYDRSLWQKAYDLLKDSYDKNQRPPSLINTLKQMEKQLNLPAEKRIPEGYIALPNQAGRSGP